MFKEFKEFIARGNVVDLAVGVVIGAAFGKIVTSVVNDLVMPPIGLVLGKVNFADMFLVLGQPGDKPVPTSVAQAKTLGIPTLNYGQFINTLIEFLIIAFVIFLVVKGINKFHKKAEAAKTTKECPFCQEAIPLAAKKCGHCTSELAKS